LAQQAEGKGERGKPRLKAEGAPICPVP
jgi:hypothetical protein